MSCKRFYKTDFFLVLQLKTNLFLNYALLFSIKKLSLELPQSLAISKNSSVLLQLIKRV